MKNSRDKWLELLYEYEWLLDAAKDLRSFTRKWNWNYGDMWDKNLIRAERVLKRLKAEK